MRRHVCSGDERPVGRLAGESPQSWFLNTTRNHAVAAAASASDARGAVIARGHIRCVSLASSSGASGSVCCAMREQGCRGGAKERERRRAREIRRAISGVCPLCEHLGSPAPRAHDAPKPPPSPGRENSTSARADLGGITVRRASVVGRRARLVEERQELLSCGFGGRERDRFATLEARDEAASLREPAPVGMDREHQQPRGGHSGGTERERGRRETFVKLAFGREALDRRLLDFRKLILGISVHLKR